MRRLVTLAAGLVLVGAGVATTINADLGVAPYDVLTTGVSDAFGIPIGVAAIIVPTTFVVIGVILGGRPGIGTAITMVGVGPVIGAALRIVPDPSPLGARVALFVVGSLLIACGITAVVVAEIGPGPAELVMLAIHDRGRPLARVRTAIELVSVAVGWALGGQVGVGTAVVALTIGPLLRILLHAAGYRRDPDQRAEAAAPGA